MKLIFLLFIVFLSSFNASKSKMKLRLRLKQTIDQQTNNNGVKVEQNILTLEPQLSIVVGQDQYQMKDLETIVELNKNIIKRCGLDLKRCFNEKALSQMKDFIGALQALKSALPEEELVLEEIQSKKAVVPVSHPGVDEKVAELMKDTASTKTEQLPTTELDQAFEQIMNVD